MHIPYANTAIWVMPEESSNQPDATAHAIQIGYNLHRSSVCSAQTDEHIHWNTRVGTSYYHRQSALTPQSGLEHIVDKDLHIPQTQCQLTARDFSG
jgi:hypothetical protein